MGRQFSWLTNNERRWRIEDISKHEWTKRNIWTLPAKRKYHLQHRSKYNPEYMLCQSNSSMHHYECIALCKDISLQRRQVIMNVLHHDNMVSANSSTVMATTETLQPALQFRHQDPTKSVIHLLKLVLVSQ